MLLRKGMIILVLSVLVVAMTAASVGAASAISNNGPDLKNLKSGTGGYVLSFGKSSSPSTQGMSIMALSQPLSNTIIQGQTQWAQKTIGGSPPTIYTDIYWGNTYNSISVIIYTPDGYVLGPAYDNVEGIINGDMPITISRPGGVANGMYYYQIYGYRISGSQYYTFS